MENSLAPIKGRVKQKILNVLKYRGSQSAPEIANCLDVSPMAIRQHLQTLQTDNWVTYQQQHQEVGRPIKCWQLTSQASQLFPNHHGELSVYLLNGIRETFGEVGLNTLIEQRVKAQIQAYQDQLRSHQDSWRDRVYQLAQLRTQEGYMAEVIEESAHTLLLVENHCSICTAAETCPALCQAEYRVFKTILGEAVTIERTEHILSGDRRCAYRITPIRD